VGFKPAKKNCCTQGDDTNYEGFALPVRGEKNSEKLKLGQTEKGMFSFRREIM